MPCPRRLSPVSFVWTPASVNFAFDRTNSPRSCSLSITFFFSGGMTSFACRRAAPRRIGFSDWTASLSRSSIRPFCMSTSTSICRPRHAFEPDHRSVCGHRRLEKRGIHLLEVRVAVRPIDDGGETSFQRHGLAARVHLKIRGVCRSLNLDAVKSDRGTLRSSSARRQARGWCRDSRSRTHTFR